MNLARVEQYLAEVLSRIEGRTSRAGGRLESEPLLLAGAGDEDWSRVVIPANLGLVGTVNMDESAHGFSRKVLDRAFTLELSDIDLSRWQEGEASSTPGSPDGNDPWPVDSWFPRAVMLDKLEALTDDELRDVREVITALSDANNCLASAQLQVGYRTRDEVALFVLHTREVRSHFVDSHGLMVDPLDLALHMKVLPRIVGGSAGVRRAVVRLLGWAATGVLSASEDSAEGRVSEWDSSGRPPLLAGAAYPRTAARLCLMWERLAAEGFTSFWL